MVQVRYFSKSGHTKAIAEAIAEALDVEAADINTPLVQEVDILFLGGALYAGGISGKLKNFIKTLSPEVVKKVVVFSTTANPNGAYTKIKKALDKQGVNVLEDEFHCTGKSADTDAAKEQAAAFAKKVVNL